jgi:hypothetical protein
MHFLLTGMSALTCLHKHNSSAAFKHFDPLLHISLWHRVLIILSPTFRQQKTHYCMLLVLGANLYWSSRLYTILTWQRRLNHTRSMSPAAQSCKENTPTLA